MDALAVFMADRLLHEALTAGPDPLHLALVFNLSHTAASRYAAITQGLLDDQIEQATGQRPAQPRYPSDEPTGIPGPQPRRRREFPR